MKSNYRCSLEIITPIRGRKPFSPGSVKVADGMFRNNNPDKGTETLSYFIIIISVLLFRNNNPDKGTETVTCVAKAGGVSDSFRNNNPDKGTETNKAIFKEITWINIGL